MGYSDEQAGSVVAQENIGSAVRITLWDDHIDMEGSNFPVVVGDICTRTSFADDSFDAILFMSVFEHLHDIEGAFNEICRIVRDGGLCFSEFGPIWTGATGHHLYLDPGHPALDFTQRKLPSHMHLLFSREEIITFLIKVHGVSDYHANEAVACIFDRDIINRQPYEVYAETSKRYFRAISHENFTSPVPPLVREALIAKGYTGAVDIDGGVWCLRVDRSLTDA